MFQSTNIEVTDFIAFNVIFVFRKFDNLSVVSRVFCLIE